MRFLEELAGGDDVPVSSAESHSRPDWRGAGQHALVSAGLELSWSGALLPVWVGTVLGLCRLFISFFRN